MDMRSALKRQYHAALKTLRIAIEKCPEELWDEPGGQGPAVWRVAYHALFYANFYLQQRCDGYAPWSKHRDGAQRLSNAPCEVVSRAMMLEFWDWCDAAVDAGIDALDLDAPQCGFPWYLMPTLDHQIVNIRHIQNHAAALAARLRSRAGVEVEWVGG